jgi:hypothetical protein
MLAVEKARRLAGEGFRTALVCYHEPLARHLTQAVKGVDGLEPYSFRGLVEYAAEAAKLLGAGVSGLSDRELEDARAEVLVRAVNTKPGLRFDAIVVDEGQDFNELGWLALQECLREGRDSILYVFYDDNQRVYADRPLPPVAEEDRYTLAENVRNTREIHRALAAYYRGTGPSRARGPIGRAVETIGYATAREMAKRLGGLLHRLVVSERVPASQIAVLTPRPLAESELTGLRFDNGFRLVDGPGSGPKDVLCAGVAEFKGLERAVAIVTELDESLLRRQQLDDLCYVAFSRARSHLILMGCEGILPGLLAASTETVR